jgi:hypothetical protein
MNLELHSHHSIKSPADPAIRLVEHALIVTRFSMTKKDDEADERAFFQCGRNLKNIERQQNMHIEILYRPSEDCSKKLDKGPIEGMTKQSRGFMERACKKLKLSLHELQCMDNEERSHTTPEQTQETLKISETICRIEDSLSLEKARIKSLRCL